MCALTSSAQTITMRAEPASDTAPEYQKHAHEDELVCKERRYERPAHHSNGKIHEARAMLLNWRAQEVLPFEINVLAEQAGRPRDANEDDAVGGSTAKAAHLAHREWQGCKAPRAASVRYVHAKTEAKNDQSYDSNPYVKEREQAVGCGRGQA